MSFCFQRMQRNKEIRETPMDLIGSSKNKLGFLILCFPGKIVYVAYVGL